MKKKKNKNSVILIAILVILGLIILSIAGILFFVGGNLKVTDEFSQGMICGDKQGPCEVTIFTVEEGMTGREVLDSLEEEGIIPNADLIYFYSKIAYNLEFKAGSYKIPTKLNLDAVISYLCNENNRVEITTTLVIPEGSFAYEFANIISNKNGLSIYSDDLLAYWKNEAAIRQLMPDYSFMSEQMFNENIKIYLEGYLFPSTYEFYLDTTCEEVTRILLNKTQEIYDKYKEDFDNAPVYYHYNEDIDKKATIHEIFTMASILQWESGSVKDMKTISGVFYNHLNAPDYLRSTVTSCYSADLSRDMCSSHGDDYTYVLREDDYTYNTYLMYDLPVGPVCNPGETAIEAALNPEETDYYYFVGDYCSEDGGTVFAVTYEEHNRNIEKYVTCEIN